MIECILRSKKNLDGERCIQRTILWRYLISKNAHWFSENIPGVTCQVENGSVDLRWMPSVHDYALVIAHQKAGEFQKRVQA